MNHNYLEEFHAVARIPMDFRQRFYPTAEEKRWALEIRKSHPGPLVCLAPSGSNLPKWWPYSQKFMNLLAESQVHCFVLGDLRGQSLKAPERYGHVIGLDWSIRQAMALCQVADAVVGTETSLLNAVAFESLLKVVILSHSSMENLAKHWVNTKSIIVKGLKCQPCHRIHNTWHFCHRDPDTQAALCHGLIRPQILVDLVLAGLGHPCGSTPVPQR